MARPPIEVRIEHPHATKQLEAAPRVVQDALRRQGQALAADHQAGTYISLRRVPARTLRQWQNRSGEVKTLFKIDLPRGWRALYTVASDGPLSVVAILEVVSHTDYERLLGYN
jgi:hypothetical protein